MPSAFPTISDVTTFLTEAGFLSGSLPTSLVGVAASAKEEWERDSGFVPWIALSDITRYFDPPSGYILDLAGGLATLTTLTIAGQGLTEWQDFWLEPPNAVPLAPWTFVRFAYNVYGEPQSIEVTGKWGYRLAGTNAVPQDVFDAVLRRAAGKALAVLRASGVATGPLTSVKQDDVAYAWGEGSESQVMVGGPAQWEQEWRETLARYKRRTFR